MGLQALGINKASGIEQAGHNRDNICYPEDDCSHVGGAPDGFRWYYDLDADEGAAFEVSIGRALGSIRLELALAQRKNDVEQKIHRHHISRWLAHHGPYSVKQLPERHRFPYR